MKKNDKLDYKIKNFYSVEYALVKYKSQVTEWKKIICMYIWKNIYMYIKQDYYYAEYITLKTPYKAVIQTT